jgi:hypothetical protein
MANILTIPESGIFFDRNTAGAGVAPVLTGNASGVAIQYDGYAGVEINSSATGVNYLDRFSVEGTNGRLFGVTDEVVGTVFSVNDAAGLPIVEVESTSSYDKITLGEYGSDLVVLSGQTSAQLTGSQIASESWVASQGYLTSETDDQNLNEVLGEGNTSSYGISVNQITGAALTIDTDTLYVDAANDSVGIGTTSPNVPLEVHGADITSSSNTTAVSVLRLVRDITDSSHTLRKDSAVDFMLSRQEAVANNLPYTRLDIRLAGTTDSSTPSLDVMSLLHNGNVGIGTTNPSSKLVVADGMDGSTSQTALEFIPQDNNNRNIIFSYDRSSSTYKKIDFSASDFQFTADGQYPRMVIENGGNVGIGTTSPNALLHVSHATAPTFRLSRTGTGQIWQQSIDSSGRLLINEAASEGGTQYTRLAIDDDGDVGIGITSPSSRLHISSARTTERVITESTNTSAYVGYRATNGSGYWEMQVDGSNQELRFLDDGSERMRIDSSGNVGIGTNSPARNLHIHEGDSTLSYIQITNNTTGTSGSDGVSFGITSDEVAIWNNRENTDSTISTNNTERVRIKNDGNVGIGVAPSYKLDVSGDSTSGVIAVRNAANGRDTFRSENASGVRTFNIGNDGSGHGVLLVRNNSGATTNFIAGSGNSYFNGGNVGIGTTSPSHKLEIGLTSSVALANQPAEPLHVSNNVQSVDGRVFISVKHDVVNTASAVGAGFKMTAAAVTSGTASYDDSLIFLRSAGTANDTVHSAPKAIKFYVDNHATNAGSGANYNDLGDLALTIAENKNATFAGDATISGGLTVSTDFEAAAAVNFSALANAGSDVDKFLVSDSGDVKFRTGAEVLSDIGGITDVGGKITKKISGDGSATTFTVAHSFGTPHVMTQLLDYGNNGTGATYEVVQTTVKRNSDNAIDIVFGVAPTTSEDYLVLITKMPAIS